MGPDMDALSDIFRTRQPAFYYTVPTFANPTGAVVPIEVRREVHSLCSRFGVKIIADGKEKEEKKMKKVTIIEMKKRKKEKRHRIIKKRRL